MISQDEAADRLRAALEAWPLWQEANRGYHPRTSAAGTDRVVGLGGFDIEAWVSVAPGGIYEYWFSERGRPERPFRTADVDATVRFLLFTGLRAAKGQPRRSEWDEPPGFRISESGNGVVLEWGQDRFAEFLGTWVLQLALGFAWFTLASPEDIERSVRSTGDDDPLFLRGHLIWRGPTGGDLSVPAWRAWLEQRAGGESSQSASGPRPNW